MFKQSKKIISIILAIILLITGVSIFSAFSVSAASSDSEAAAGNLNLKATSNFFPTYQKSFDSTTDTVTVTYYINSATAMLNTQWELTYDPDVLQYNSTKNSNVNDFMPCVINGGYSNTAPIDYDTGELLKGKIFGNVINLNLNKLQSKSGGEIAFLTVTFDVIGKGDTNVDLYIDILTLGEKKNGDVEETLLIDDGKVFDTEIPITKRSSVYSGLYTAGSDDPTQPVGEGLELTATSNYFPTFKQHFDASADTVTVTYYLNSQKRMLQSQWSLTYDPTVLKYNSEKNNNVTDFMPCATAGTFAITTPINTKTGERIYGMICGTSTNLGLEKLQTADGKKVGFVSVTFDVIGSGDTNVNLYLDVLTLADLDPDTNLDDDKTEEDVMNNGVLCDYTTKVEADTLVYAGKYGDQQETTVLPSTEPTTTQPSTVPTTTEPTTEPTTVPLHKYIYGDVDLNDAVTIADATMIQKYLSKFTTFSDVQKVLADVSDDSSITIKDATLIQKYLAKISATSKIGQPYYA